MMQMCAAENFLGKRLRFSAWMKTENTNDGGAHLWFRVDGKETNSMLQFDNMDSRPVKGTTDWQQYAIVLDVPANSAALAYGFFVQGNGQAWVSGVKIEEVGADVPSTNMTKTRPPILPNAPVNLGFVAADQSNLPIQSKSGAILNHMAQLADIPGRNIAVQIKGNGAFDTYTEHLVAALHSCQQKPTGLIELLAAEVGCEISADGHISDVHVVRSSGNSAFDQSCVETFTRVGSAGPTPDGKSGKWTIAFQVADSNR
jgi:TonB family protein